MLAASRRKHRFAGITGASSPSTAAAVSANSRSVASSGPLTAVRSSITWPVGLAVAAAVQLGRLPRLQAQADICSGNIFGSAASLNACFIASATSPSAPPASARVGDDHVRPPHAQGQHHLAQHLLGGVIVVQLVPGLQQVVAAGAGQVRGDGELPQRFGRGPAGLPHGAGEAQAVGGAGRRRRGRVGGRSRAGRP